MKRRRTPIEQTPARRRATAVRHEVRTDYKPTRREPDEACRVRDGHHLETQPKSSQSRRPHRREAGTSTNQDLVRIVITGLADLPTHSQAPFRRIADPQAGRSVSAPPQSGFDAGLSRRAGAWVRTDPRHQPAVKSVCSKHRLINIPNTPCNSTPSPPAHAMRRSSRRDRGQRLVEGRRSRRIIFPSATIESARPSASMGSHAPCPADTGREGRVDEGQEATQNKTGSLLWTRTAHAGMIGTLFC